VIIVTYGNNGNNGYNGHYGQKAWDINWKSYEPCKNRAGSVMRVYSHEGFQFYFYLATAKQRDEAKRN